MAKIVIECSDLDDAADSCREVADAIDAGYTNGLIGWSGDGWSIEH